jgi:hypothetical protein
MGKKEGSREQGAGGEKLLIIAPFPIPNAQCPKINKGVLMYALKDK